MFRYKDIIIVMIAAIGAAVFLKVFVVDAVYVPSASMENGVLPGDFLFVNKLPWKTKESQKSDKTEASISFPGISGQERVKRGDVIVFKFTGDVKGTIIEDQSLFVKRCVGIAGDNIEIDGGKIFVNSKRVYIPHSKKQLVRRNQSQEPQLYPFDADFTLDNYGPVRVPKKGDIVLLNEENYKNWESIIKHEGHSIAWSSEVGCLIDGYPRSTYIINEDYLFVLGDNFYESYDSRFWGFVPESNVLGEALFVYWSVQPNARTENLTDQIHHIRWNRIGTMVQ